VTGRLFAGTSGYSYPDWAPTFYPPGTRADGLLRFYGSRFAACELNNTWYQTPSEARVRSWIAATPPGFRFAVKGQRGASLRALLADPGESVPFLTDPIRQFGDRLGTVLFRVPAGIPRDEARLTALLERWPRELPLTMEFQDSSWFVDEVLELCRSHGAVVCATELDSDEEPPRIWVTGSFLYVRLRREQYSEAELGAWADRLVPFLEAGHDVFAFFRHDATGQAAVRATALSHEIESRFPWATGDPPAG
jgi:uncharacterized protein YecE (DUF72 family)